MGWDGMGWDGMGWDTLLCPEPVKALFWDTDLLREPATSHQYLQKCSHMPANRNVPSGP